MRRLIQVLVVLGIVVAVLLVGVTGVGVYFVRASFPQVSGTKVVPGVNAPVDVLRDRRGIPNIYGDNVADLFFAQGYVHAQDRFWEMDVRRHITSGRLSEMFGTSQVPTDAFLRTLGWQRIAEQELDLLNDRSLLILDSYAAGVNAYLADHSGANLSAEYAVLALQNPGYRPEPWRPADSVAWLKALAWDLRGNMTEEIYRSIMAASMGVEATQELYPNYPYTQNGTIVEGGAVVDGRFEPDATVNVLRIPDDAVVADYRAAKPVLVAASDQVARLTRLLGPSGPGIGSNSWAVSGSKTDTGMPLLANDPHLAPSMPSLWYQSGLHCRQMTLDCDYDVTGWTMAGLPGIFIGHNASMAWGFTNLGPDVTDLVLHQVDGDTYLFQGERVPLDIRNEVINVAGGDPVEIQVRTTRDGPIISGFDDILIYDQVAQAAPVPAPGSWSMSPDETSTDETSTDETSTDETNPDTSEASQPEYAVALRWTALDPQPTFDAFDAVNTATTWDEFREAARALAVPAQNLLYADTSGRIAYQAPGRIPIREGYDGKWPIPGWTGDYEWSGFIPFNALPFAVDPPEGWIVTANQAVVGPNYPYFITDDWAYGARGTRIIELLEASTSGGARITADRMRVIQMDSNNGLAEFLVPRLLASPTPEGTAEARELLQGWDFQQGPESAPAAYFNAIWAQMISRMFDAAADVEAITASGNDRWWLVIEQLWDDPTNVWWDDKTTTRVEDRDELLNTAQREAHQQLIATLGNDPTAWRWGDLHTLTLTHGTLGSSGIQPIEMLFNRGPVPSGGSEAAVNATGWTPAEGFQVDWVPSMRQVVDLANFDNSAWVNLTGNSGHAFHSNYQDQLRAWTAGELFPWPFTQESVERDAEHVLRLEPLSSS